MSVETSQELEALRQIAKAVDCYGSSLITDGRTGADAQIQLRLKLDEAFFAWWGLQPVSGLVSGSIGSITASAMPPADAPAIVEPRK